MTGHAIRATRSSGSAVMAALAGVLMLAACLGDITGSGKAPRVRIDFGLAFQGSTGGVVDQIAQLRVLVTRVSPPPATVVVDERRPFADPGRGVERSVTIDIPLGDNAQEEFDVVVEGSNTLGEAIYRVGPIRFTSRDFTGRSPVTRSVPMQYVGPGSDAVRIVATPGALALQPGQSGTVRVEVFGPNDASVDRAPLDWSVTAGAHIVSVDQNGRVTANTRNGLATVLVRALTPLAPSATVSVVVSDLPIVIELVSGGGQSAAPGTQLPGAIVVRASRGGAPAPGVTVTFSGGSATPGSGVSDANGLVQTTWTLSTVLGLQSLTVSAPNADPIQVTATAAQAALSTVSGDGQIATVGSLLSQPVIVRLMAGSTPLAGREVTFTVTQGGGSLAQTTVSTDASGHAQTTWTLGVFLGLQTIQASASGALGSPLNISATATANARQVFILSVVPSALQPGETATVRVFVRASNGSPVGGAAVSLSSTGLGNQLSPSDVTTNAGGEATAAFTSTTPGAKTITATSGTSTSAPFPVAVAALNAGGTALIKVSGDNQVVVLGTAFPQPVVVRVLDVRGLPVENAFVDFASAQGELRRVTNASGEASVLYTLPLDPVAYPPNVPLPIVVRLVGTTITVTFTYTSILPEPGAAADGPPALQAGAVAPPVPPRRGGG